MAKKTYLNSITSKIWMLAIFPVFLFPICALGLILFGSNLFDQAIFEKVKRDNELVRNVINNDLVDLNKSILGLAGSYRIRNFYINDKNAQLNDILASRVEMMGYDFVAISDLNGTIQKASFYTDKSAASKIIGKGNPLLSDNPKVTVPKNKFFNQIINNLFYNNESASGIDVISLEQLNNFDPKTASKARIELFNTKNSDPIKEKQISDALFLFSAAPILNENNEILAFAFGAKLLNNNNDMVDKISNLTSSHGGYLNLTTNVTLFLGPTRIATTLITDNKRAVGTQIASNVAQTVLKDNKSYLARAFVVNDWAYTAYEPLKDFSGETIGAFFVGIHEQPFIELKHNIFIVSLAFVLLCIFISSIFSLKFAKKIITPLRSIEKAISKIRDGDKNARIIYKDNFIADDEFNKIKQEFNLLMDQNQKYESQLISNRENLEILVTLRTSELEQANRQLIDATEKANASNHAKSLFLSNMSHELRTPLNGIIGFSHILKKTALDPKQANAVDKIITSGTILLSLINEVLDLSKIEAGKMSLLPEPTNLSYLVDSIEDIFRTQIEQKNLAFNITKLFDSNLNVNIDQLKLKQIIINLISNALKFTTKGSVSFEIKTLTSLEEAEFYKSIVTLNRPANEIIICIKIIDTGAGISKEAQERIFVPFEQEKNNTSREHGGTGLGLTISRKLAQMMGGDIYLTSNLGSGSTFTVTISATKLEPQKLIELKEKNSR